MHQTTDLFEAPAVSVSWLWAVCSAAAALAWTACGQGLGAIFGGCEWIGVTLPVHRPVWALVNQPTLDFASRSTALGYWLGGVGLAAAAAALVVPIVPRARTVAAELASVQIAWMAAAIGVAWLPLVDLEDGHPARWLSLHARPAELLAAVAVIASALAVPPTLRLLSVARAGRSQLVRSRRLAIVILHLILPVAAWVALATSMAPSTPLAAITATALPAATALGVAWIGYPAAFAWPLDRPGVGAVVRALGYAILAVALVWVAGRPLSDGRASAILWRTPSGSNNIRPWVTPVAILGASIESTPMELGEDAFGTGDSTARR